MVPRFLSTGFKYAEVKGFTDVQALIDAAYALVATPTDPSSGWTAFTFDGTNYVSPLTSLRVPQFKFRLTRSTQYRLMLTAVSANGNTLGSRGIQIPANACDARIFAGDGHFCIDVTCWTAAGEFLWCGTLDSSPDQPDFYGLDLAWVHGSRRTSDYAREYSGWSYNTMRWGDDAPGNTESIDPHRISGGSNGPRKHLSGALIYCPRELMAKVRGDTGTFGTRHWIGRCWQIILVPDASMIPGSKFYCPIDTGVLAQFYTLAGADSVYSKIAAIRIG